MGMVRMASEPLKEEEIIHKKGRMVTATITHSMR